MHRRPLLAAGAALGLPAAPAAAQEAPRRDGPGTPVTTLVFEGSGAGARAVTTFGFFFEEGTAPLGTPCVLKDAAGNAYPVQIMPLGSRREGQLGFVQMAAELPAIAEGATLALTLVRGEAHPAPGPMLSLTAASLAGRSAQLRIGPPGQPAWTLDLVTNLPAEAFAEGPLFVSKRVALDIPAAAVGGAAGMRFVADLTLLKDGTLWADVSLRNDKVRISGGGEASYDVAYLQDGQQLMGYAAVRHRPYRHLTRLADPGTLRGTRPGGLAPRRPICRPPVEYLAQRARVIANYDMALGVDPAREAELLRLLDRPGFDVPFGTMGDPNAGIESVRGIIHRPGSSGLNNDIGPITVVQGCWLTGQDRRMLRLMIAQAEAGCHFDWHYWDPSLKRGQGGWLNGIDLPGIWADGRDGRIQPRPISGSFSVNPSHMGDFAFIPALCTGRRMLVDEVAACGAWSSIAIWTAYRGDGGDEATGQGLMTMAGWREGDGDQLRTHAWVTRAVAHAALLCRHPAFPPLPDYYPRVLRANTRCLAARRPTWQARSGEPYGFWRNDLHSKENYSLYHSEYLFAAAAAVARAGIEGMREHLDWARNWVFGRFLQEPIYFVSNHAGIALSAGPGGNFANTVWTWARLNAVQNNLGPLPVREWTGEASSSDYFPLAVLALAELVNLFPDDPRGRRALRVVEGARNPAVGVSALRHMPSRSVTPIGWTRAAVAPEVVPDQAFRLAPGAASGAPVGVVATRGGFPTGFAIQGGDGAALFRVDADGLLTLTGPAQAAPALGSGRGWRVNLRASNAQGSGAAREVRVLVG